MHKYHLNPALVRMVCGPILATLPLTKVHGQGYQNGSLLDPMAQSGEIAHGLIVLGVVAFVVILSRIFKNSSPQKH